MKFNKKNSFFFAGCERNIKLFQFRNGYMQFICEVKHSNLEVKYLNCTNYQNQLISGCDLMIKIKPLFGVNNHKILMKIIPNSNQFSCFAISDKNNLLVAGLQEHIYFWEVNCEWYFKQDLQVNDEQDWIYNLSFNESETKLISCTGGGKITVIELESNQEKLWKIIQIIYLDNFAVQATFFGENSFVIHLYLLKIMLIYELNQVDGQFIKSNQFLMESEGVQSQTFNSSYIKQRQLFIKQDKFQLILYLVNKNQELQIYKKLLFDTTQIWGTISDDGLWLIVWENASQQLKIISLFAF
ncbi:unnamed protein product [Paramecium sonneborni]|uniref:WD40-repeat-containing domain n=1 Tax=Paramecium sonneborni TaxID=65129 RepID=A0A8S1RFQ3_9CILI|nr:unnamed protein product [Paramecium sonneborni]